MLGLVLFLAMQQSPCPITIGVGRDGTIFTDRFNGWYKTAPKTLASLIRGGCYNDANPSPVTSVELALSPDAPKPRIALAFSILERAGWSRDKIKVQPWMNDPLKPR